MQISNTHIICPRWCDKEVSFRTELQRTNCVIWRTLYFQVFHWVIQRSKAEAIRRRSRGTKTKSWRGTSKSCVRWAKHFLTIETVFRRDLYLYCFSKELIETVECQFQTRCFRLLIYTELVKTASCRFDYKMAPFDRCIIYRSWLWTLTGKSLPQSWARRPIFIRWRQNPSLDCPSQLQCAVWCKRDAVIPFEV